MTSGRPGTLTGTVVDSRGQAVAGICVTAQGPGAAGRTTVTSAGGIFVITDLHPGPYLLRYRNCLDRPGSVGGSRAAALGPGPLIAPAAATRGYVTAAHSTMLGRVALRSRAVGRAAALPPRPALRRFTAAQLRHRFGGHKFGGIAGRVLGPHGRPVKGLCYMIFFHSGFEGGLIDADGRYRTGKSIPPGTYTVGFSSFCDFPFGATSNWAPEWYRGKFRQSSANPVVVKPGKITGGIDGVMRPGAVITGTVTGHTGAGLARVCVVVASTNGRLVQQISTPRSGQYRLQGLGPGRYNIGFFPNCDNGGGSKYLPQWWPGTATPTKRGLIKTGIGTVTTHVDAKMVLGGTISGVVKFRNRHGQPIKGICVDLEPTAQLDGEGFLAATNTDGKYAISGLPAGRYAVNFSPGCNNNGNYLSQNYPHSVTARPEHVTGGINAYLQPGATVIGTVTAKSDGAKLGGICVTDDEGFAIAQTHSDGTYVLNQLPRETTQVQFFNCGNHGNFAPQLYPGQLNSVRATSIKLRPGQVVKGIDAAMAPGGTISGTITLTAGGKPSNVCVEADPLAFFGNLGGSGTTSRRGSYVIENLPPGTYQVQYLSCGGPNIADSAYAGPGQATGDESRADQIYVPVGGVVSDVDAVLQLGGSIGGWIYGPKKQQGSFVCEDISDARTGDIESDVFGVPIGDGYTIFGFAPGRYLVEFVPCGGENLADQWFNRAARPAKATPILVRPRHTTGKITAWMTAGGSITGHVVSQLTGKPLTGVCVEATGVNQPFFGFGGTDQSGKYVVTGLNTGSYRLIFVACGSTGLVPRLAGPVRAIAGKTVAGPKVAMRQEQAGAISGSISAAGSRRQPVADACVDAFPVGQGFLGDFEGGFGATGSRGRYEITGLVPGKYDVFVGDENCTTDPDGLVPQWYLGASRMSKATAVTVAAGRTTKSISVTLQRDGSISGTVTGPKPASRPLAGICVQVVPVARGATPFLAETKAPNGGYQTGPLPPGKYRVEFESGCGATGYAAQWWHGAASMKAATPVTVRAGRRHLDISATMTRAAG